MKPEKFLEYLSSHLKSTIARSISYAMVHNHLAVTPTHLFYALLEEHGSIGCEILTRGRVSTKHITPYLEVMPTTKKINTEGSNTATIPEMNSTAKQMLEKAILIAYEHSHQYVGTEHLLAALIQNEASGVLLLFEEQKISIKTIRDELDGILDSTSKFPSMEEVEDIMDQLQDMVGDQTSNRMMAPKKLTAKTTTKRPKNASALDVFTVNLTDKAIQKTIDPVIGRDREIERLIHILLRRNKNNPALVGEPGVGKTAIIEGLAKKIVAGEVPDLLKNRKIISLDLTLLLAGTIYRGEFESRLKAIVDELSEHPEYILFIDEIHNIIGAGSNQGTMDAANILKPALARGQLRCIGATTIDEYKKHISADPALERRFQILTVEEPSIDETKKILRGIKKYYEDYHSTAISDEAIESAINLSTKYIHDNYLPDKAIDLLDEASAAVRVSMRQNPLILKQIALRTSAEEYAQKKDQAIEAERLEDAVKWKEKETALQKQSDALDKKIKSQTPVRRKKVTVNDVIRVLSNRLNIPQSYLEANEWERIKTIRKALGQKIFGQDVVLDAVVQALQHASLDLKNNHKPHATMLFAGPSGVGKTALAKHLARELYHDEAALIKFDMSEFSESHSVSKILGSPAGYVGYRERNRFTDEVKKRPYSVILFDEFEKAHVDVQKLLLQILDEGVLTDSQGKKIHFNHSIIILTTNVGAELFQTAGIGFDGALGDRSAEREKYVTDKLRERLGASLFARLPNVCLFHPLSEKHLEEIVLHNVMALSDLLRARHGISITTDGAAVHSLANIARSPHEGARHIEATVEKILQSLIADIMNQNSTKKIYKLTKEANAYRLV